jgi:hypothetical protein
VVVLAGLVIGWLNAADRDAAGTIVAAGDLDVVDLEVGDCFDDGDAGFGEEVSDILAVPCDAPHDNEVFHVFTLASQPELPDIVAIDAEVETRCLPVFESFVGIAYEESNLEIFTLTPTEEGWRQADREVVCALYDLDLTKLEGTARGSQR